MRLPLQLSYRTWWDITTSAAVTGKLIFTYRGIENACPNPTDAFCALHWNGSSWDACAGSANGVTTGTGTLAVTGSSTFCPWILSKPPIILPIELSAFRAQIVGSIVHLNWTTQSELANNYFTVQKTADLETIKDVVTISGAGTSTTFLNYSAIDNNPYNGISYYRLKLVDINGETSYSDWVLIDWLHKDDLVLLPNPSDAMMTIQLPDINDDTDVKIFNMLGELVYRKDLTNHPASLSVDVSPFLNGMYMIFIESKAESTKRNSSFIINRIGHFLH